MLVGGQWMTSRETLPVYDPQDQSLIDSVPAAKAEDMQRAIEEGKEGAATAAELPVHRRIDILYRASELVEAQKDAFTYTIAREGSKTIREAGKEVDRCVQTLRVSAEEARRVQGETIAFDQMPGSENRTGYYYRFPVGLIGAITPFNDPLNLVAHKVGPAIAAGNAIIVKPATVTPFSALKLAEVLMEAGLPPKILSVVTGRARDVGDTLVTHPDVRMISFTGGWETGRKISEKAGIKKMSMELGSNSPVIVLDDADLEEAVNSSVSGAFAAAGQNCLGVQRIYIQASVYERFVHSFVEQTQQYRVGDKLSEETDMGPLISEDEAVRVENWVKEAVSKGARLHCGGQRDGAYVQPTVLTDLPEDATLARDEVFGPVVSLFSVPDLDTAVRKANDADYGLQTGIFTNDINRAFQLIHRSDVGGVMVNDSSDYRIDAMPFGGVKGSGIGREGVRFAIQDMTETKVVGFKLK